MTNIKDIDDIEVLELMKQDGKEDTQAIDSRIKEIMEGNYGEDESGAKYCIIYGAVVIAVVAASYGGYRLVKFGGTKLINFIKSKKELKRQNDEEGVQNDFQEIETEKTR